MTAPIDIDSLTETFSVDPAIDFMITENEPEQATSKATVSKVQAIDLRNLDVFDEPYAPGDVFFGEQANTQNKFSSSFENVTLPSGTRTWIYANDFRSGWFPVDTAGDKLLAVKGGTYYSTAGISGGTWTMEGVNGGVPGSALTVEQIPSHSHRGQKRAHARESSAPPNPSPPRKGKVAEDDSFFRFRYFETERTGGSQSHNHGDSWRPKAYVGLIIEKL